MADRGRHDYRRKKQQRRAISKEDLTIGLSGTSKGLRVFLEPDVMDYFLSVLAGSCTTEYLLATITTTT